MPAMPAPAGPGVQAGLGEPDAPEHPRANHRIRQVEVVDEVVFHFVQDRKGHRENAHREDRS